MNRRRSTRIKEFVGFNLAAFAILCGVCQGAGAQSRSLPRAGFQNFSQPSSSALPSGSGVYLRPGESRTKGNQGQPYDPWHEQLGFVRWERNKMPLHVWIAPGLKLPELPLSELKNERVNQVRDMLSRQDPLVGLEQAKGWTDNMCELAAAGIEMWRGFEAEGLISFDFTEDPRMAHILVFWTDGFKDDAVGGTFVDANTCSQPLAIAQIRQYEAAGRKFVPVGFVQPGRGDIIQNPVVIELGVGSEGRLPAATAHEFGHALGIIQHSPYREDLMYVDKIVRELSPGDKATFRALYHVQPQGAF
jgi:hypothetical protein